MDGWVKGVYMPFTTLQDRALQIPRQPVPGSQYTRAKFQLGELHTILPPIGTEIINCQGVDIGPEGKKLQITKELVALIQAGFVRIAHDIVNPDAHKHSAPPSPSSTSMGGDVAVSESHADTPTGVLVSSLTGLGDTVNPSSSPFSSVEEIKACNDKEKLRLFISNATGFPANERAPMEALREAVVNLWTDAHGRQQTDPGKF